jgi:glycosyltransferase involved in cell wall biosynthesis
MDKPARFVVATPGRSVCDDNARALYHHGLLRFLALATRRGTAGVPMELTRLNPKIGLAAYAAAKTLSVYHAESFRFRLHPWFDHWVRKQLQPGDHIISSYGYANDCFRRVREQGGKTFVDGGNSHPQDFWAVLLEEHKRWHCPHPPVAQHYYERNLAMMPYVDYVLSPSAHVTNSFLRNGFRKDQILKNIYPIDLSCFKPSETPRNKNRPLTVVNTGMLSLRKGTPYLLEGFRLVLKRDPSARLRLTSNVQDSVKPILAKYSDLPIDWSPPLPHVQLAERLRTSDVFVLPSLEEGLVRTALEALACGVQAVLTPNTGASEYLQPGVNGEVVPIRDPQAIADAIIKCADRVLGPGGPPRFSLDVSTFSFESFEKDFISQLQQRGLV